MASSRQILHRWVLPAVSGLFLALALPPFERGEVGWVALIPLLFALEGCSRSEAFRRAYVTGLVFFGMTTWWIIHVSLPGMIGLIGFLALYFGAGGAYLASLNIAFSKAGRDSVWCNLVKGLLGAAGWVTLEWVRGKFPLGGFGWNGLGVTQHASPPMIQFASYTAVYGVSALVFFLNYSLFCTIRRFVHNFGQTNQLRRLSWEFYFAMLLVCSAFAHGFQVIRAGSAAGPTVPLHIALIQGNIPQSLKFDEQEKPMILGRYGSLTETATWTKADLIIWPETATPEAMRYDPETFAVVTNAAVKANAYLLTGTIDETPYSDPVEAFNAAILVRPDGSLDSIYRKIHLVPFGEYVPLRKITPILKFFTPITESFERGHDLTLFNVNGLEFGTVICFEDTVPALYRQFVKRTADSPGADFMVNLTNDAWFQDSPESRIHLANAVFRTVETRRWLVRATNNGLTCVVDEFGVVRTQVSPFCAATLSYTMDVRTNAPETYYTQHGDVFVGGCAVVSGLFLLSACWQTFFTVELPS